MKNLSREKWIGPCPYTMNNGPIFPDKFLFGRLIAQANAESKSKLVRFMKGSFITSFPVRSSAIITQVDQYIVKIESCANAITQPAVAQRNGLITVMLGNARDIIKGRSALDHQWPDDMEPEHHRHRDLVQ